MEGKMNSEASKPITLRIELTDTEAHEVTLLPFDQLTVEDYLRIAEPTRENEQPHEQVSRIFGIPERITWVMKTHEVERLMSWYADWMRKGAASWASVKAVTDRLPEKDATGKPWTMAEAIELLSEHSLHRRHIEVDGVRYIVPQRIEHDTTWGQWLSLKHVADRHKGPEAELYPKVLAVLCMAEGERYPRRGSDETPEAFEERFATWTTQRRRLFRRARFVDALACCAFFLSSSEQFTAIMGASMTNCLNWSRRWKEQGPPSTASDGEQGRSEPQA